MANVEKLIVGLPAEDQSAIYAAIGRALLWRGWDSVRHYREVQPPAGIILPGPPKYERAPCGCHACDAVREIAQVFEKNGIEMEEYT